MSGRLGMRNQRVRGVVTLRGRLEWLVALFYACKYPQLVSAQLLSSRSSASASILDSNASAALTTLQLLCHGARSLKNSTPPSFRSVVALLSPPARSTSLRSLAFLIAPPDWLRP